MTQIKCLVFGTILLVQLAAAQKYGSNDVGALYQGGGGGGGGGYSNAGSGAGGGYSDSGAMDLRSLLASMPQFQQSGPSLQSAGGANVPAAIQTKRTVEVKPINIPQQPVEPHVVDVEATYQPVHVIFRSSSSPVMVQQIHTPAQPAHVEPTQSEDEPHRVQHSVTRPVIQEVREIIQPYRRVLQEIRPVLEEVRTVVARAEQKSAAQQSGVSAPQQAIGESVAQNLGQSAGGAAGAGGYGASGYAAASVPAPTYSSSNRGRQSNAVRATQRRSFNRRALKVATKRQQVYVA